MAGCSKSPSATQNKPFESVLQNNIHTHTHPNTHTKQTYTHTCTHRPRLSGNNTTVHERVRASSFSSSGSGGGGSSSSSVKNIASSTAPPPGWKAVRNGWVADYGQPHTHTKPMSLPSRTERGALLQRTKEGQGSGSGSEMKEKGAGGDIGDATTWGWEVHVPGEKAD